MGQFFPVLVLVFGATYFLLTRDNYDPTTVAGKRVLVTGASSGIGEELAYHYSRLGARLVLTAQRAELLENVTEKCRKLGANEVSEVPADIVDSKDRNMVLEHTRKVLGGLDHLILNQALIRHGPWQSNEENMTNLQVGMKANFYSCLELASLALPMLTESQGHIGVVSSVAGKIGEPLATAYSASQFAMRGFFSAWRLELISKGTGVSVTIAVLGPIDTDTEKTGLDMSLIAATPEDAAEAMVRAVEIRAQEFSHGWRASLLLKLHKIFPEFVESQLKRIFPFSQT